MPLKIYRPLLMIIGLGSGSINEAMRQQRITFLIWRMFVFSATLVVNVPINDTHL